MALTWIDRRLGNPVIFHLPLEAIEIERTSGFKLLGSTYCPPVMPFIQKIFEDPTSKYFIDGNHYADITLYLLDNVLQPPGYVACCFP